MDWQELILSDSLNQEKIEREFAWIQRYDFSHLSERTRDFSLQDLPIYCLWRYSTNSEFRSRFRGRLVHFTEKLDEQLKKLDFWAGAGIKNFMILPNPAHQILSLLSEDPSDSDSAKRMRGTPVSLSVSGTKPAIIHTTPDGIFILELDPGTGFACELEIGNRMIEGKFVNSSDELPNIEIYVNGVGSENLKTTEWVSGDKFTCCSTLLYPELASVSFVVSSDRKSITLVFWDSVIKRIVDLMLPQIIQIEKERLEWWLLPVPEMGGLSPKRCLELRLDDRLLNYLMTKIVAMTSHLEGEMDK
jgi:hypothetical protein